MNSHNWRSVMFTLAATTALVGCGDTSTDLASAGNTGPNPGIPAPPVNPPPVNPPPVNPPPVNPPPVTAQCPTGTTSVQRPSPTTAGASITVCQITGTITTNLTLIDDFAYELVGQVQVGADSTQAGTGGTRAVLTIEPGTTIYGRTGDTTTTGGVSFLSVRRGSQIFADGTRARPIVFTSAEDFYGNVNAAAFQTEFGRPARVRFSGAANLDPNGGEWGGLVINGLATINSPGGQAEGEGDSGFYGGTNDADNSGILRFVQIRYAGAIFSGTNELNSLALQGVGNGTVLEYVQVHNGADDGFEWFGGTVNGRFLVATGAGDDSFDWVQGWRGRVQFALAQLSTNNPDGADNGIEADNLSGNLDATPRSAPIFSNLTIVGARPSGGEGIQIRVGSAGQIFNAVVANTQGPGIDLDDGATFAQAAAGNLIFRSVLVDSTIASPLATEANDAGPPSLVSIFNTAGANNSVAPVSLQPLNGVNILNGPAEQAVPVTQPTDSFFLPATFIGAVNSPSFDTALPDNPGTAAGQNWLAGWSFLLNQTSAPTCPDIPQSTPRGITPANGICTLQGTIVDDISLVSQLEYRLTGQVIIGADTGQDPAAPLASGNPAIVRVAPGTRILGNPAPAGNPTAVSYLTVSRGSQLIATGTAANPITFAPVGFETANLTTGVPAGGTSPLRWGGLVINGRAPLNVPGGQAEGEGDSGFYGGTAPNDSSGTLRFVRVLFPGAIFSGTNELNGIAFQGVGRGTTVEFVQIHNATDDGIEWFGGTVDARFIVVTGAADDSLDWVQGWNGRLDNVVVFQNAQNPDGADNGIEADNLSGNLDASPRSNPIINNLTMVGARPSGGEGIQIRVGSAGRIFNAVVANFQGPALDLDDAATFAQAATTPPNLFFRSLRLDSTGTPLATEANDVGPPPLTDIFNAAGANNSTGAITLVARAGSTANRAYISGTGELAVPAFNANTVDSFFAAPASPNGIGGVRSAAAPGAAGPNASNNWTLGWTVWLND